MRQIVFSEVGVIIKAYEDIEEIYLLCTALGIPIKDAFKEKYEEAQNDNLAGWYVQCTLGGIRTNLFEYGLEISIIKYPIKYSMESLDFAIACQLLMLNQENELKVHLAQHCKEYK